MSQLPFDSSAAGAKTFDFCGHRVRVVMRDGEPWFVAVDVAEALGYRNAPDAVRNLTARQKADTQIVRTSSNGTTQTRSVTVVNESGLYRLVLRSRKPEALRFSDWVTGEVLPAIRKTGGYSHPQLDLTDGGAMVAARRAAFAYMDAYRDAVNNGKERPRSRETLTIPADVLKGILSDAVMSQRMLLSFDYTTGRMIGSLVPEDASVVSFAKGNYFDVASQIPMERLPELMGELNKRVANHLGAFSNYLKNLSSKPVRLSR